MYPPFIFLLIHVKINLFLYFANKNEVFTREMGIHSIALAKLSFIVPNIKRNVKHLII